MNILWISHNVPYPPKTGVLQRNYNLVREAAKHANIYLVAILQENILPVDYDLDEAERELGKLCKQIDVIRLPAETSRFAFYSLAIKSLFTKDPMSVNCVKSAEMRKTIRQLSSEIHFDIVHFDTIGLATYRNDVGNSARILNHHNIESHLLDRRTEVENNPLKRFYYGLEARKLAQYEAEVCAEFDINFTVSELDKERLLEIAPGTKADVIANGVDVDYFMPQDNTIEEGSLIMVSGMNWYPNRDAVIYMQEQIWPLITSAYPNVSWVVVGSSPPQQLIDLAETDSRITITGFVDDVRPYIDKAHVYLCPMRDGGGTRLKILDALSMAKPIVATTMAYEGIHVTKDENALFADTPEEFVKQIGRLLENKDLCQQIGSNGRQFVIDNFSWKVIGEKLGNIYHKITGK